MASPMTETQERLAQWAAGAATQGEVTLHIGNIPPSAKKSELMRWIDESGFAGTYDFFYLPRNFSNGLNSGYAFINFVEPGPARRFKKRSARHALPSGEVLHVQASATQGLVENMVKWARARARRVKDPEVLPYIRGLDVMGASNPARVLTLGLHAPQDVAVPLPANLNEKKTSSRPSFGSEGSTWLPGDDGSTGDGSFPLGRTWRAPFESEASSSGQGSFPLGRMWRPMEEETRPRDDLLAPAARAAFPSAVVLWRFSA